MINTINLRSLFSELYSVNSPGDFEALRMVGNGDIFVAASVSRLGHFLDRARSVTPLGVHLQITLIPFKPRRAFRENRFGLGSWSKNPRGFRVVLVLEADLRSNAG